MLFNCLFLYGVFKDGLEFWDLVFWLFWLGIFIRWKIGGMLFFWFVIKMLFFSLSFFFKFLFCEILYLNILLVKFIDGLIVLEEGLVLNLVL